MAARVIPEVVSASMTTARRLSTGYPQSGTYALAVLLVAFASAQASLATVSRMLTNIGIHGTPFSDWQHYAMSWNRVASGGPLYDPAQLAGPFHFPDMLFTGWAYSPPSVILWAPFAWWPGGYVLWTVVNVGLLLTALWAASSRQWRAHRLIAFGVILLVLGLYPPFIEAASLGNPDLALAGLLMWAWLSPRWAVAAGVLGGLAKLAPAAILLWVSRDGRRYTVAGFAILAGVSLLLLPLSGAWLDFATTLRLAQAPCGGENVAVACLFPDPVVGRTVGILLAGTMSVASAFVPSRWFGFALACLAYPVANPDLRGHTFLPLVPVVVAGAMEITRRRWSGCTA